VLKSKITSTALYLPQPDKTDLTMPRTVKVTAASRLHFGMFSFSQPDVRAFGGVGVMIDRPGVCLTVQSADKLTATGPLADRALQFAQRLTQAWSLPSEPACEIRIETCCRDHTGLGVGTQLALAVASGMSRFLDRPEVDAVELARLVGRGRRSAVGTYGFMHGGLIVEAGKPSAESAEFSTLVSAMALPESWRFVLACPTTDEGLHGNEETVAFEKLPPVPRQTTDELCRLALLVMIPAASDASFEIFREALYRYGVLAGSCFSSQQGGPFASKRTSQLVETIRGLGIAGVGQSSWGPTVFALVRDPSQANRLVEQLRGLSGGADLELTVAAPSNHAARIETI